MINAPINTGQDWQEYTQRIRTNMIDKVSRFLGEDIRPYIEVEEVMNPVLIEDWYSGKQGSIYGNSSNSKFAAFYRHPNFSKHIKNLYFVGVTVHRWHSIQQKLQYAACLNRNSRALFKGNAYFTQQSKKCEQDV